MKYYRTTDAAILDLPQAYVASLPPIKQSLLRLYVVATKPTPSATQFVKDGLVTVDQTTATKTWVLENKSPEQLAAEKFQSDRKIDLEQIRAVYLALRAGTGTAAERLTRCERVLARLVKDAFGEDPA
jgi:hypothetical protein